MGIQKIMNRQARKASPARRAPSEAPRISSSAMLREAADRMGAFHVRSLAVVENKEIVGRITDHDVTQAVSAGMDPGTTPVKYAMAPSVVPGEEEMDEAVEIMEDA